MPPTAEAQPFGVDESAEGAARQASVDEAAAREGVAPVLLTIRDAVEPGEFDDVLPQLGREYAALLETARDRLLPHRPRGPDPALAHAPSLDRAACRTVPWSGSTPSAW